MLELLDAKTDDFVFDGLLGGEERIDVGDVESELYEVLTGFGVVHLLPQGHLLLQEEVRIGGADLE